MTKDPIFYHDGNTPINDDSVHNDPEGWYFWDEVWAHYYGPYGSREEANRHMVEYCKHELYSR